MTAVDHDDTDEITATEVEADTLTPATEAEADTVTRATEAEADTVTLASGVEADTVTLASGVEADTVTPASGVEADTVTPAADAAAAETRRWSPAGLRLRLALMGLRTRILVAFVGLLAIAAVASVLVAREVLYNRLDERIDGELQQEASELRRLAEGIDPSTGLPFGDDVRAIFTTFFERNTPSRGEVLLTFVGGELFLRSRQIQEYRLEEDPQLVAYWSDLGEPRRGEVETPAGTVDYLALPLKSGDEVRGVFVVTVFRELQQGPFDDAIVAIGIVGLAILLLGSVLAWFVAGGVLRPVRSLTQAAQSISESDLTQRIEVRGHDELAELAKTFNAMLDRLEKAFSGQRRFLADAGHELRTPITIVRGHLELLEEDPEERAATIALVMDELDRMSRMVDDLLLLAKTERPDFLHLDQVDVGGLTDELATKASTLAPRKWTLEAAGDGVVVADRQRLTQALMQLAANAAVHTHEGGTIAFGSAVDAGEARFWVRDEGHGIAPEDQETIFERFQRRGADTRAEGAGLGLPIVRAIAEAHGGRVELESAPGAGALFTVVVPARGPTATPPETAGGTP
ncbi:MAG TPA: ATP-binding protein [Thermoleophilia bacterium]|nr:ATP-binding protein [Thermoleophilia bacterium]